MSFLTQERLKELLSYDPISGEFVRKKCRRTDLIGSLAGAVHSKGYIHIRVDGKDYFAHRLAWLYVHGRFPESQIDHIDNCKSNNRIANLREASGAENRQNIIKPLASNKSSGVLGVHWHAIGKKWRSSIRSNGKQIHLGLFDTKEEARAAYVSAKRALHPFSELVA